MKVLVIGSIYSMYVYHFVKDTLPAIGAEEIVLWNYLGKRDFENEYDIYYRLNGITVFPESKWYRDSFSNLYYCFQSIRQMGRFDVCHAHFLSPSVKNMAFLMRNYCDRLILNFWGSDWLRISSKEKEGQKELLEISDSIVTDSMQIYDDLSEFYARAFIRKTYYIRFKLPVIEEIEKGMVKAASDRMAKKRFAFPLDKRIVVCGYSSARRHHQVAAIRELKKLEVADKNQIHVVFPFTYGGDSENYDAISKKVKDMGISYSIITEYLSDEDIGLLRKATDIFINIQPTDSYSSTMVEYLFLNKRIICGEWLDYSLLEKEGAYLEKIKDESKLPEVIRHTLRLYEEEKAKWTNGRKAVEAFQTGHDGTNLWGNLYTSKTIEHIHMDIEERLLSMCGYYEKRDTVNLMIKDMINIILEIDRECIIHWIDRDKIKKLALFGAGDISQCIYNRIGGESSFEIVLYDTYVDSRDWYDGTIVPLSEASTEGINALIITPMEAKDYIKNDIIALNPHYNVYTIDE
ncbi:MAG: hypothetical protein K5644_02240, partial [Lachnospiraceae bacterium]|nr:hypothetical protein [Lachnospiraceae bacterium]